MKMSKRILLGHLAAAFIGLQAGGAYASDGDTSVVGGTESGAWAVMAGSTLKSTLEGWARSEGWEVIWDNPSDYRLRASATLHGDFVEAVGRLVDAVHQSNPELSVTLYTGNKMIHIDATSIVNE